MPRPVRFMLLLALALNATQVCSAALREVPGDHASIQAAIDAADAGDTILVGPGTWYEHLDFRGRAITVRSIAGAAKTVLDGAGSGPVVRFVSGEGRAAVLDGFTITHGRHPLHAGGIHIEGAAPTLRNNQISDNHGGREGHGISVVGSLGALIENNQILRNQSWPTGHGAGGGGGIGISGAGTVEIRGNLIARNAVTHFGSGGGIRLDRAGAAQIIGNHIEANSARLEGGGIAIHGSSAALIENNLINDNRVLDDGKGGGVAWLLLPGSGSPALINNTIANNAARAGSAVHADGVDATARIVNNLLLAAPGMNALECGDFYDASAPLVHHNNVHSEVESFAGVCVGLESDNLSALPIFEAASYALAPGSPGIDAGDDTASSQLFDLHHQPRIGDGNGDGIAHIDIGALESGPRSDR